MAVAGKRERSLWIAAVPMALLALSCVYPIYFAVNNALKTRQGYILDRFGVAPTHAPELRRRLDAAQVSEYFVNSVLVTVGAVLLLTVLSSLAGFALAMLRFPGGASSSS